MPDPSETLRVLLIQVRDSDEVCLHERDCIRDITGLRDDQFTRINIVADPGFDTDAIDDHDAVIIGGAAVHSAVADDPFTPRLTAAVRRMVEHSKPLFGSCWGHQFIARALGGAVVHDDAQGEVGAFDVIATPAGLADPVFGPAGSRYPVLMGHHDRVAALPPSGVELARSERCGHQAFRIDGRPVWGAQFHAELTPEALADRLARYQQYKPTDDERSAARPVETPEAAGILRRFIAHAAAVAARP